VESEEWKDRILKKGGLVITLRNNTQMHMERIVSNLNCGVWRKEPPMTINPESVIEFGCEYSGTFNGKVEGNITYKYIEGEIKGSLTRSYNFIKCSWNSSSSSQTFSEEKIDGFGNYFFTLQRSLSSKNSVMWTIQQMLLSSQMNQNSQSSMLNQSILNQPNVVLNVPTIRQQQQHFAQNPQLVMSDSEKQKIEKEIIAKMNKMAEMDLPKSLDNQTGLNVYYRNALTFWEQGIQAKKSGDTERAYILYLKFTTFLLERIPMHINYSNSRYDNEKLECRSKCPKVIQDMEIMQKEILEKKIRELVNDRVTQQNEIQSLGLPDVPKSVVSPQQKNVNSKKDSTSKVKK